MNIEYRRESGQTRTGFDNIIYMTPEESGDTEIVPNSNPQPQVEPAVLASASRIERFFQKAAKSKLGRAAAFIALLGGGAIGAHEGQANAAKAFASTGSNRIETTQNSEGLTTQEIFAKLKAKDPLNTFIEVLDINLTREAGTNRITGIDVLANESQFVRDPSDWKTFSSKTENGVFTQFAAGSKSFSAPTVFYKYGQTTYVAVYGAIAQPGSTASSTEPRAAIVYVNENQTSNLIPLSPEPIPSKAPFPETGTLVLGQIGKLQVLDMKTNSIKTIPIDFNSIKQGAKLGAEIQRGSITNNIGEVFASVYTDNVYGLVPIKIDLSNNTLTNQPEWLWPNIRSDSFFVHRGQTPRAFLYNGDNQQMFIGNPDTKTQEVIYNVSGILNGVTEEFIQRNSANIIGITADEKSIIVTATGFSQNGQTRPYFVSWPQGTNPEQNSAVITYRSMVGGLIDKSDEGLVYPNGVIELGEDSIFVGTNWKSLIRAERNPNGSLSSTGNRDMLESGISIDYSAEPATPTVTATAVVSSTATFTPTPTNTPTPTRTATSSPTPIITPSTTSTVTGNNFKVFLPVTTRKKTAN